MQVRGSTQTQGERILQVCDSLGVIFGCILATPDTKYCLVLASCLKHASGSIIFHFNFLLLVYREHDVLPRCALRARAADPLLSAVLPAENALLCPLHLLLSPSDWKAQLKYSGFFQTFPDPSIIVGGMGALGCTFL